MGVARDAGDVAQVIALPVQKVAAATATSADAWTVDEWGRDGTLARLAGSALRMRWDVAVGGHERLPAEGPALVVVNTRHLMLTTWFAALVLARQLDRPVRFVGRPDTAPVGAVARRLGGVLDRPDEVAAALRGGELLVVGASGVVDPQRVGTVDHRLLGAAVLTSTPVFPAAVWVAPLGRSARIEIADAVRPPRHRRGPLAELELADSVAEALQRELAASGAPRTGTPLDWLPVGLGGGR